MVACSHVLSEPLVEVAAARGELALELLHACLQLSDATILGRNL